MAEVTTDDGVRLYVEVEGKDEPVTLFAHGITNNRRELAPFTPMVQGTKVRFDFRGHGRSDAPQTGYRFRDFAGDVDAVATAFGATRAVGTSLGAGAIGNLLTREPDRFERLVFLLPAGLDGPFQQRERFLRTAGLLDGGATPEEALAAVLSDPERVESYLRMPWLQELDEAMWEHDHPEGVSRAIRAIVDDWPIPDREMLRAVTSPVLLVCIEDDPVHPAELGRILHELLSGSELLVFPDGMALMRAISDLMPKVVAFLS